MGTPEMIHMTQQAHRAVVQLICAVRGFDAACTKRDHAGIIHHGYFLEQLQRALQIEEVPYGTIAAAVRKAKAEQQSKAA